MFQVLDELIGPLGAHITQLISEPGEGTDDVLARNDIRKSYLSLLNTILTNKLQRVFLTESSSTHVSELLHY